MRAGAAVAVLAVSGALLLSACSSSSGSSGSSAADGTSSAAVSAAASASGSASNGKGAQAMEAYRQCLSQHGVTLPTFNLPSGRPSGSARPSGRPSGQPGSQRGGGFGGGFGGLGGFGGASPDAATQKALDACKSLRPQFTGRGGGTGGDSSAFQAFTSCLKDHGVTLSTPSPGATNTSGGRGFGALRGLNTADPKTAKAYTTCKPLLPTRPTNTASPSAT